MDRTRGPRRDGATAVSEGGKKRSTAARAGRVGESERPRASAYATSRDRSDRDGRGPARRAGGAGGAGRRDGSGGGRGGGRPLRVGLANPRRRVRAMFLVVCFVFTVFAAQLVRLQGIEAGALSERATLSRTREFPIAAQRGSILDRSGTPLAVDEERRDIVADPEIIAGWTRTDRRTKKTEKPGARGAARILAPALDMPVGELETLLRGTPASPKYARLAVAVKPETWRAVEKLDVPGLAGVKASRRTYPAGPAAAPIVGFVGPDGRAADGTGSGLEYLLDDQLAGKPGKTIREVSADGRIIPMGVDDTSPATPGRAVRLTLDNDLNWYAHQAIEAKVKETKAESGMAVVMDRKGRLLAVAQSPGFDPAKPGATGSVTSSLPFQEVFEPGSTAKVMSIGTALEEGVHTPTSPFTVDDKIERASTTLNDSHEHPVERLTLAGILAQSSNVGTILATEQIAPATIEKYYRAFGVGAPSGVGFPGESRGIFAPSEEWEHQQRWTILYGQSVATTAIQATGVFQTIANQGVRVPPTLVDAVAADDGTLTPKALPEGRRVVSEKTAAEMTLMLESVVGENGTAAQAGITGVPVAGKTGTANRYSGTGGMMASFVGFAPADKPQFVVGVFVANPKGGHYGGSVAGPVFQKVMSYALEKYGVAPTGEKRTPYPLYVGQKTGPSAGQVDPGSIPDRGAPTARSPRSSSPSSSSTSTRSTTPSSSSSASSSSSSSASESDAESGVDDSSTTTGNG